MYIAKASSSSKLRQNTDQGSLKLPWSVFCRNLELPELDKIQTIEELLCVKHRLIPLPLFDVSQIDFIFGVTKYLVTIFLDLQGGPKK